MSETHIYAVKTTANREEQVIDFIAANAKKKNLAVYSVIAAHGMRGYIFIEAANPEDAQLSFKGVPYARGLLPNPLAYEEIEPMLEQAKTTVTVKERDIVEIIHGPFKNEKARVKRIDETKEEVVVELLEAAIPIPVTVKIDSVKVIRSGDDEEEIKDEE